MQHWSSAARWCEPSGGHPNPLKVIITTLLIICANSRRSRHKQMKRYRVNSVCADASQTRFIWILIPPLESDWLAEAFHHKMPLPVLDRAIVLQRLERQYKICILALVFLCPNGHLDSACWLSRLCSRNSSCPTSAYRSNAIRRWCLLYSGIATQSSSRGEQERCGERWVVNELS